MDQENTSDGGINAGTSFASRVMNALLGPLRPLVSKNAQKAYLGTFLFFVTAIVMVFVSAVAYGVFYYKIIPQVGLERVVHLQFGDGPPWGTATLDSSLVSLQPYDVHVELELPRTPSNLAAGNFMLDLTLLSHPSTSASTGENTSAQPIARSRRPAILTYASSLVDISSKISFMPLYILGWRREAEKIVVQMLEQVQFSRGAHNLPGSLRLEIHSHEEMQVYKANVAFRTKLTGLRWIMYNWRITSFFIFVSSFWSISMTSALFAWIFLTLLFSAGGKEEEEEEDSTIIKKEDRIATPIKKEPYDEPGFGPEASSTESESDSPGDQPSEPQVKREPGYEADDESHLIQDQAAGPSGTGTGLEAAGAAGIQRRRSHLFKEEHT